MDSKGYLMRLKTRVLAEPSKEASKTLVGLLRINSIKVQIRLMASLMEHVIRPIRALQIQMHLFLVVKNLEMLQHIEKNLVCLQV